jgi:hypothetical protein
MSHYLYGRDWGWGCGMVVGWTVDANGGFAGLWTWMNGALLVCFLRAGRIQIIIMSYYFCL